MENVKETVNLQLKDPSSEFSDNGKKLTFRSVLSFERSEKVNFALKTGIVRIIRDEKVEQVEPALTENVTLTEEKQTSKRK